MFAGLVREAKAAASGLLLKYVARASVAVPFAIALGFALAATTVMLVQWFGQVAAYWIMAAGLAVIGLITAAAVSLKEVQEEKAEELAAEVNGRVWTFDQALTHFEEKAATGIEDHSQHQHQ